MGRIRFVVCKDPYKLAVTLYTANFRNKYLEPSFWSLGLYRQAACIAQQLYAEEMGLA